jgi:hypothetical protein
MRTLLIIAALATYGGFATGCQSEDAKHQQVHEQTVTDPNGNVISHTESKSNDTSNSNNPNNP